MNSENKSKASAKPRPEDVSSPDTIIKAMYECISGPAGTRNWHRLRSLYLDGANLVPTGKLAVILHRMWVDETQFNWGTQGARS